jgi:hypothetical protein
LPTGILCPTEAGIFVLGIMSIPPLEPSWSLQWASEEIIYLRDLTMDKLWRSLRWLEDAENDLRELKVKIWK